MPRRRLTLTLPDVALEGVLHLPDAPRPHAAVLVCHPHPFYGGTMDNNVVMGLCWALERAGLAALRYNYRGVGGSEGQMVAGEQDVADAVETLRALAEMDEVEGHRVGICGYSFGAGVALEVAARSDLPKAVAVVGCPTSVLQGEGLQRVRLPKLLISGSRDPFAPAAQVRELTARFADPKEVHLLEGADHFLVGREAHVGELAAEFFARWLAARSPT